MKKILTKIKTGEYKIRYKARIEDVPSEFGTSFARIRQRNFLKEIIENDGVLSCGPLDFQKMNFFHSGNEWVAELEAETDNDNVSS
ncbi:hypothetical protein EBZ38_08460 [bacterium]|nr:hypothetical protein [bacterium]